MPRLGVRGNIRVEFRALAGRALCVWGDAGWGGLVKAGRYRDGRLSDELVNASVARDKNGIHSPGRRGSRVFLHCDTLISVPDFARRVAAALGLPFHEVLVKTDRRPEQRGWPTALNKPETLTGRLASTGMFPLALCCSLTIWSIRDGH